MRFEGCTSREAEAILTRRYGDRAPREKTIRNWFAQGGRLRDFYQSYALEETGERQGIARNILSAHAKNAARTIVRLMLHPNVSPWIQLRTAIYIIDRELGPAPKTTPESTNRDIAREILEAAGVIPRVRT